jgi:glutamine synthetase
MAAIIGAGLDGYERRNEMQSAFGDCGDKIPSEMTSDERLSYGICDSHRLPRSLEAALQLLSSNATLRQVIGGEAVDRYIVLKEEEIEHLKSLSQPQRRNWFVERY